MNKEISDVRPWYREPWVWLLIALPMSAVIGGIITIYLAIASSDGLVVDDYYKRGKTINLELARDQAAAFNKVEALLQMDSQNARVTVTLASRDAMQPAQIRLLLLHPTRAGHDQTILLDRRGESFYSGTFSTVTPANWHVQLESDDWRISGRAQLPLAAPLRLVPQDMPNLNIPAIQ